MVLNKPKAVVKNQTLSKSQEPESESPASPKQKPKTPARKTSPARTKSPARSKSPARKSPSRTKKETSPPLKSSTPKIEAPKARSPIRKSPSRKSPTRVSRVTTKSPVRVASKSPTRTSSKSPTRVTRAVTKSVETYFHEKVLRPRKSFYEVDSDSDNIDGALHTEKPQAAVRGRARRLEAQVEKIRVANAQPSTYNLVKRVTQNSQSREVERVVHLKHFDNVAQKLGEFSDEDETTQLRKSTSVERIGDFQQITEFGGPLGALFYTILTPLSVIALLMCCNESQCSFTKLPNYAKYLSPSIYFDLSSVLSFLGYAIFLALLSVIPFGGKQVTGMATKQGKFKYTMNGLFSCLILTLIGIGLELRNIPVTEFIVKHLFHILIGSILFGLVLTTYAFIRSFYVPFSSLNAHVLGRNKIYGFFMGRELNPRAFNLLDLKMFVFRLALIGSFLLDFAIVYKSLGTLDLKSIKINPTLIVLTIIHSIYYLDALAHEPAFVTSFEIQYEGFGYMSGVGYLVYPFMMASVTKYVVDYNVNLAAWKLILAGLVFLFGYVLFRGSNNQKDAFRKNPYDPALSHLETIPTTKGKKLICSGFWGVVRHPNYLGDILMNLSFIAFALDVPPVLTGVSIILLLIHRAIRDNIRCKQKYGAAWDRFCSRVRYVLLPKVY